MRHRVGRRHTIRAAAPLLVLAAIIILASGFLLSRHTFGPGIQPFPDGVEYADAAAGHVNVGTRVAAVLLVLAVGWAGLELGGPWAAILAVLLVMVGRFARQS